MTTADVDLLDDVAALERGDPEQMLRAVAGSAAQVREAVSLTDRDALLRLAEGGRPRAVVVTGMGGSGIAGDVLAAVAGMACPAPVVVWRGYGLPAWVGAADVVLAVSCSGGTEETLSATDEAIRRSCRLFAVGAADSPLADRAAQARAGFVPVPTGRQPRASLWALSVPLVLAGRALGLLSVTDGEVAATAARLEAVAVACRPAGDSFTNPAKRLAVELVGHLPVVWGTSGLAGVAAARCAAQLAENAKTPAVSGVLPEAGHNQVVTFDGPYATGPGRTGDAADLFRDRSEDPDEGPVRLRLLLLRDTDEHPRVTVRADACRELAGARGVGVSEVTAAGSSPLERLAALVGMVDFASVYLALLQGIDPTPVAAITALKAATGR